MPTKYVTNSLKNLWHVRFILHGTSEPRGVTRIDLDPTARGSIGKGPSPGHSVVAGRKSPGIPGEGGDGGMVKGDSRGALGIP